MVAHLTGSQGVMGSNPISSTESIILRTVPFEATSAGTAKVVSLVLRGAGGCAASAVERQGRGGVGAAPVADVVEPGRCASFLPIPRLLPVCLAQSRNGFTAVRQQFDHVGPSRSPMGGIAALSPWSRGSCRRGVSSRAEAVAHFAVSCWTNHWFRMPSTALAVGSCGAGSRPGSSASGCARSGTVISSTSFGRAYR